MLGRGGSAEGDATSRSAGTSTPARSPRTGTPSDDRSPHSARSRASGTSGRSARRPTREKVCQAIREPEEAGRLARLREKLRGVRGKPAAAAGDRPSQEEEAALGLGVGGAAGEGEVAEDEEDVRDIVEELCLSVEPVVQELGDPEILAMKKAGTLHIEDEEAVQRFKRHKAALGPVLFEAENANNIGVEYFSIGDMVGAMAYFSKALELCSKERKPAVDELAVYKDFVRTRFQGQVKPLFAALSDGDWRAGLGRRRFLEAMKAHEYPGDADSLFTMLDSVCRDGDGKVTAGELAALLKANAAKVTDMDRDRRQKGVVLSNIAACHLQQGEAVVALQRLREAAKAAQRASKQGIEDPAVHRIIANMAVAYIRIGDLDAALNFVARILDRREAQGGRQEPDVLQALYMSGYCFLVKASRCDILFDRKRMDKHKMENAVEVNYRLAQCSFKELLRRQQAALLLLEEGKGSSLMGEKEQLRLEIARTHEVVAEVYGKRGQLDGALPHLRAAMAHKQEILSDSDPELVSCCNVLASFCLRAGLYEEALESMQKAVEASGTLFGESSVTVTRLLYHVGLILFKMAAAQLVAADRAGAADTLQLAAAKLSDVLQLQLEQLGSEDADVAATHHLLGSVHMAAGSRREARRHFERALLARIAALGRSHAATASSAHALGALYARMPRRQEEAVQLLRKAALVRERQLAPDSLQLAESLHELGSALLRRPGRAGAEAALQHLSRAAQIREKRLGKENLRYAASMHQVGQAHAHLGLFGEAKMYLQAAVTLRERLTGAKSAQLAMSRFALGVALQNLGDFKGALKHLRASYSAREALHGEDHAHCADSLHQIGMVYVQMKELRAGLPFLHRALDIRKRVNDRDAAARQEDSDEDPRDLVPHESQRERRIQQKREQRRKQVEREGKRREREERKHEEEMRREREHRAQLQSGKSIASSLGRGFSVRGVTVGDLLSRNNLPARLKSSLRITSVPADPDADVEVGKDDGSPLDDGSPPGSPKGAESPVSTARSKTTTVTLAIPSPDGTAGSPGAEMQREDSEVCLADVDVDIRGWLTAAIAASMQTLAYVYIDLIEYKRAHSYLSHAICLREELFGNMSPEFAETLHAFGVLYLRQERFVQALENFKQALKVRETACGHNHESTGATCVELADVFVRLGSTGEASVYLVRGINIREAVYGPGDPTSKMLREKFNKLHASELQYDPVAHGEAMPHFAKRSPESLLHGFQDRDAQMAAHRLETTRL